MSRRLSTRARTILKGYETGGRNTASGKLVVFKKGTPALETYLDDVGVPTIGWGHTGKVRGQKLAVGMTITMDEAEALLSQDVREFEDGVTRLTAGGAPTNQNQFDALVLIAFNIGLGKASVKGKGLAPSTLLRKHRAGDYEGAAAQFALWNKAGGRVLAGLTRRRAEEATLYRQPVIVTEQEERVFDEEASKRVEPDAPKSPTTSPGVIGAVGAAASAIPLTVENISTATSSLREVRNEADQVQSLAGMSTILGIIIFILAAYIIWRKFRDNKKGLH